MKLLVPVLLFSVLLFGRARFAVTFTAQTQVTVPGMTHQLETPDIVVTCYDTSAPPQVVEPDTVTVDPAVFDVVITFATPQSGKCVLRA